MKAIHYITVKGQAPRNAPSASKCQGVAQIGCLHGPPGSIERLLTLLVLCIFNIKEWIDLDFSETDDGRRQEEVETAGFKVIGGSPTKLRVTGLMMMMMMMMKIHRIQQQAWFCRAHTGAEC